MGSEPDNTMVVTLTAQQLRALVAEAVADAMAELDLGEPAPELVDRRGLAQALSVSLSSVDRLIREGAPLVRVGDAPRFRVADVVAWLQARAAGGPTHAIEGGRK